MQPNRNDRPAADRDSEHKSGLGWLWPLLLLPLLLLLGWLAYRGMGQRQEDLTGTNNYRNESRTQAPANNRSDDTTTNSAEVTELSTLLGANASEADSLNGQSFNLTGLSVVSVTGDRTFTVGSTDSYLYAILVPQLNNGQAENTVEVKAGQTVDVEGTVVKAPDDFTQLQTSAKLSDEQIQMIKEQGFYISVKSIKIQ